MIYRRGCALFAMPIGHCLWRKGNTGAQRDDDSHSSQLTGIHFVLSCEKMIPKPTWHVIEGEFVQARDKKESYFHPYHCTRLLARMSALKFFAVQIRNLEIFMRHSYLMFTHLSDILARSIVSAWWWWRP
jgi:hypothetical protein